MNTRTLVWITHSFRLDSRLTSALSGETAFVYFSPFYFAGQRERNIYRRCSQANLDAFYHSLHSFDFDLQAQCGARLHVFKDADPIARINELAKAHGFTELIVDQPLFALWHSVDFTKLTIPVSFVDSDLVDDECLKLTAKSRWMTHVKSIDTFKPHKFSSKVVAYNLPSTGCTYPAPVTALPLLDKDKVLTRARKVAKTYHVTRDRHDGQTQLSTLLHNGMVDPANLFFELAKQFRKDGADLTVNDGPAAGMLRQLAFREISIIQARKAGLTLEDDVQTWAKALMHSAAYDNMMSSKPNPRSTVNFETISKAQTGVRELDFLARELLKTGIMPNRGRMYFASRVFYESRTGLEALETLIDTFDLLGLDGQSPNNYTQCIGALGLSYGKVLQMNRDRAFELLAY